MKIVVEVSEKDYLAFCFQFDNGILEETVPSHRAKIAIANGTLLPKGRNKDLITKEQAIELVEFYQLNPQHFDFVDFIDEIKCEKPIIEADKEGAEE